MRKNCGACDVALRARQVSFRLVCRSWGPHLAPSNRAIEQMDPRSLAASGAGEGTIGLEELRALWNKTPPRRAPERWRDIKGPLDALHLTMKRLKWQPCGPFEWTLDCGGKVNLEQTPPSLVKHFLKEAV